MIRQAVIRAALLAAIIVTCTSSTWADPVKIVAYKPGAGGTSDQSAVSFEGNGVTAVPLLRGGGLIAKGGGDDFAANGWDGYNNATDAESNGDYFEWGFSSTVPYDLTQLQIRYDGGEKTAGTGPNELVIRVAINGGTFVDIFADPDVDTTGSLNEESINLEPFDLTNVTNAHFRLIAWDSPAEDITLKLQTTDSFDGENGLVIRGVEVIPEPASVMLLLGGCFVVLGRSRRLR